MPVVQLDYDGNVIKVWDRITDVNLFGLQHSKVSNCLNGKREVHANSVWILKDKFDKLTKGEIIEICRQKDKRYVQLDKDYNISCMDFCERSGERAWFYCFWDLQLRWWEMAFLQRVQMDEI